MRRAQTGFTLVEIAIVLVIIGLLIGGVDFSDLVITLKKKKCPSIWRGTLSAVPTG